MIFKSLLFSTGLLALAAPPFASASAATPSYSLSDRLKGPDGGWDYVSFDPSLKRVFVSRAGGITVVNVSTKQVSFLTLPAGRMHESLPLPGGRLLVTDGTANVAHIIDGSSGATIVDVPVGEKPDSATFDPATGLALVMNGRSGDVSFVDPAAGKVVGSILLGGSLEAAISDGVGRAFVNIEDQNQIAVIDTRTKSVAARYVLPGCDGPGGLAYAKDAGVLIAACANKVAKVVNAADGRVVATLDIGAGPDSVLYDSQRRLAFIPCGRDGVLEVIAVRGPKDVAVLEAVPTQVGARTGAVDPATGDVYLATAKYDPPPMAGGRPTVEPGTFEILVVSPGAP